MIKAVYEVDCQESEDGEMRIGASAPALEWKLDKLARSPSFHAFDHLASTDLFEPGQATILQINGISQEEQQMICATLLLQSINAYQNTQENLIQPGDENYLPYPIFILLEEAHRFVNHEPSRSKAIIRTLISERWMFGVGLGLISQYPSRLDADILHHCGSQFMMKMVSPVEQDRLSFSFKAVEEHNALQEIQTFAKSGQLFVSGSCINNSTFCQIRQSYTKVGSNRFNAIDQWLHHSQNRIGE